MKDQLLLLRPSALCDCGGTAHWQLSRDVLCSRCYLQSSGMMSDETFCRFAKEVTGSEEWSDTQLDHLLAIVVLTNRWGIRTASNNDDQRGTQ